MSFLLDEKDEVCVSSVVSFLVQGVAGKQWFVNHAFWNFTNILLCNSKCQILEWSIQDAQFLLL